MAEEYVPLKEAQRLLGVSKAKMGRLVKEGTLVAYSDARDRRKTLVKKADLDRLQKPQPRPDQG